MEAYLEDLVGRVVSKAQGYYILGPTYNPNSGTVHLRFKSLRGEGVSLNPKP